MTRSAGCRSDVADALVASRSVPERFAEVFDEHYTEVHGYIARRLGPDLAEDLAANTFLAAFRQRGRFDAEKGDPRAWLYGIATNLIRQHRRSEVRAYRAMRRLPTAVPENDHTNRTVARVTAQGSRSALAGGLAKLSAADRDVLLLVALAGLTYEEIAAALGIAYGTVASRLHRARRKLRTALGGVDPRENDG